MKIDEFIKKVRKYAYVREDDGYVFICDIFFAGAEDFNFRNKWFLSLQPDEKNLNANFDWDCLEAVNINELRIILGLVKELQDTSVKDRFPEKHYRVRMRGFNSDRGHQYLTVSTRYSTISLGSVFAAVWNTGLKQTFTADELNKIRERFKGSKWIVSMLNDGVEEVGK